MTDSPMCVSKDKPDMGDGVKNGLTIGTGTGDALPNNRKKKKAIKVKFKEYIPQ